MSRYSTALAKADKKANGDSAASLRVKLLTPIVAFHLLMQACDEGQVFDSAIEAEVIKQIKSIDCQWMNELLHIIGAEDQNVLDTYKTLLESANKRELLQIDDYFYNLKLVADTLDNLLISYENSN